MVRSVIALASLMAASPLLAEGLTVKTKLIQSQMTLDAKSVEDEDGEAEVEGDKRTIPGKGVGLGLEYALSERTRLGTELSYTEFERYDTKSYDTALGAYAAIDLLKEERVNVYGKGGLSLHQFGMETYKQTSLVNADLGLGASVALTPSLDLGADYQYSTTLVKNDMKAKDVDLKVNDVGQTRNDYSIFLAMKF